MHISAIFNSTLLLPTFSCYLLTITFNRQIYLSSTPLSKLNLLSDIPIYKTNALPVSTSMLSECDNLFRKSTAIHERSSSPSISIEAPSPPSTISEEFSFGEVIDKAGFSTFECSFESSEQTIPSSKESKALPVSASSTEPPYSKPSSFLSWSSLISNCISDEYLDE